MLSKSVTYFLLLLVSSSCQAQSAIPVNAQPSIAPHLQNCYRNRAIFQRDNRLPMTPEMLIELIRRVEDSPGFTMNIQQFTISLLHRFKQDGIIRKHSIDYEMIFDLKNWRGKGRARVVDMQFSISAAETFQFWRKGKEFEFIFSPSNLDFSPPQRKPKTANVFHFPLSFFPENFRTAASLGGNINQQDILQYSTHGFNFVKHRLLLTRLLPANGNQFPNVNGTLSEQEQVREGNLQEDE
jgi:hypothetical protein